MRIGSAAPSDSLMQPPAAATAPRDGSLVADFSATLDRHLAEALLPYGPTGPSTDPFGWRALSRELGDELVTPGFGAIFERQIQ